ncbi:ATP-binding protein [Hydrogenophaga sp.]|uniref:ATP-binding protein n=1 Tax=Hydrogenophaga sp. TaxID=1904254 RepID=UPI00262173DA|nr:ATP-binding protein [Hydrogenophaga sp.]
MNRLPPQPHELRVLLKLVTAKDTATVVALLARSGIVAQACDTATELAHEIQTGVGALVVAEEFLEDAGLERVLVSLRSQPPWSDLPIVVAARAGVDSPEITEAIQQLGNVTVIERPMRVSSLVSAARSALTARKRQYQLRSTLEGLREADQRKTEFLATLAHELRNPLAPLRTALAIMSNPDTLPEKLPALHAMMHRQVTHMVRLIDDLMEVSRITRGKIALRLQTVDIEEVLLDAIEVNRPMLNAARQEMVLDLSPGPRHVHGDSVRLTQVFSNLVNNASKFTPVEGHIRISMRADDGHVRVQLTDSGIGIPQDMLESVFGMFVQLNVLRNVHGGLGIGLTLARSLVELHGGRVTASSPGINAGTTLTVELPLVEDFSPESVSTATQVEGAVAARHRILVVDDNRDAADSLSHLFESMGAQVGVAYGARDALALMRGFIPTVAFIDIGMPDMDGHELARHIRSDRAFDSVVLVALTGWGQEADRDRIKRSGFDRHLIKPAEVNQLKGLLTSVPQPPLPGM